MRRLVQPRVLSQGLVWLIVVVGEKIVNDLNDITKRQACPRSNYIGQNPLAKRAKCAKITKVK